MDKLYKLEQIQPTERTQVGDKAFYLSRVMQQGYPVIPGFVVPADVLWEFLSTLNSTEPLMAELPNSSLHIDVDDSQQLQHFAQRLQQKIISATLPSEWLQILLEVTQQWRSPALIFRPSLGLRNYITKDVKIAGLLEAQVCNCEAEAIALALKVTWSQLFRARSLLFWQRHQIEWRELNLAVLVQPFGNAIASGCLNYTSPEIEIKASWGLGIALTQGEVLPDCYIVDAETGAVRSSRLGNKMLAYGLANSPFQADLTPCATPLLVYAQANCLQAYLLSEKQQQEYALNEINLQQLIQLAWQLRSDLNSAFTLEWTLAQSNNSAQSQLYITQVTPVRSQNSEFRIFNSASPPSPPSPLHPIPHTPHPLVRGLAAASGRVVGNAYVLSHPDQKPEIPP
ncbi:MAG TPA: phosphoenolpyruvate synthase, partial [Cyanobacteria bacterium UBA11049]|nr:phosphoenolpyruvate synthase [Cyanobacteria bacterium UBA11049]